MNALFRGNTGPGIPVLTRSGAFGAHHWSRRWMADLESQAGPAQVSRGRAAARAQWVLDVQLGWQQVVAAVQGSQPDPFELTWTCPPLDEDSRRAVHELVTDVGLPAALAGNVSDELAAVLLPPVADTDGFACTCPDQPGPCLHAIAVACVLVERLDAAPQELFRLRGYPPRGTGTGTGAATARSGRAPSGAPTTSALVDGRARKIRDDTDTVRFWDADPALPPAPRCTGAVSDLLDGPAARRMASAIAGGNALGTLAIISDLEDLYLALSGQDPQNVRPAP